MEKETCSKIQELEVKIGGLNAAIMELSFLISKIYGEAQDLERDMKAHVQKSERAYERVEALIELFDVH